MVLSMSVDSVRCTGFSYNSSDWTGSVILLLSFCFSSKLLQGFMALLLLLPFFVMLFAMTDSSRQLRWRMGIRDSRTCCSSLSRSRTSVLRDFSLGKFKDGRMSVVLPRLQRVGWAYWVGRCINDNKISKGGLHRHTDIHSVIARENEVGGFGLKGLVLCVSIWSIIGIIQMINQFQTLQRLQAFNKEILRQLDHWSQLDKPSLSLQITQKLSQLSSMECNLKASNLLTVRDLKQINHLRSLLQGLLVDPNSPVKQDPAMTFRDKSLGYKSHQYENIILNSPRDNRKLTDTDRAMKYKRKYCSLKVQYNELAAIAHRMEEEIGFLEEQLGRCRQETEAAGRRAGDSQNQLEILQKEVSLLKAENLSKEFLAKELKKEIQRQQTSTLDRAFIQEKISKYEEVISEMKLHYEEQSQRFMGKYQNLKEKYNVLLDEHSESKEQTDKINKKYNELLLNFQKKTKQSSQLENCHRYISSLEQQVALLKKQMQTQHDRERQKLKSVQLINHRVQNQRKLNKQLQKQLTASRNQKQQLLEELQQQRALTKNIDDIVLIVNNLERQNRELKTELKTNLTRTGKSQSKLRVIGQLQNMVKLHKLHMKSSRM